MRRREFMAGLAGAAVWPLAAHAQPATMPVIGFAHPGSDRLPALMADLVRRRMAVIATPGSDTGALAAKTVTTTIPIVCPVCPRDDP